MPSYGSATARPATATPGVEYRYERNGSVVYFGERDTAGDYGLDPIAREELDSTGDTDTNYLYDGLGSSYPVTAQELAMPQSCSRFEAPTWLPGLVPQSVLRDTFTARLPSLTRLIRKQARQRKRRQNPAKEWQQALDDGFAKNRANLARRLGVSRARAP